MLKRKIIKLAEKTLVVSLPSTWVNSQNIQKGDEIDMNIEDYKLIITPTQTTSSTTSITVDAKGVSERVLRWEISSLHKQGYDEIIVTNYTKEQQSILEELLQRLFVGFMVKEKTQLRIVIGQIAVVDAKEFNATLRRAFRLLNTQMQELIQAFQTKDSSLLQDQVAHEQDNNKLTNFCERLLNKNLDQKEKGHFWYVIAWNLEKISDNFKYIANYYQDAMITISKETADALLQLQKIINEYYELMYSFSFDSLVQLAQQKKELEKKLLSQLVALQGHEVVLIHYLHAMLLQVADFSASMIALHYEGDN